MSPPLAKHLVLVGIMGAGKSTVGRLLAQRLGLPFSDIDPEMERRSGTRVRTYWEGHGDAAFAVLERAVLDDFLVRPPHVIALGGGAFARPEIRALLKDRTTTIWLKASSPTIIARIESDDTRNPETRRHAATEMPGLAERRAGLYGEADIMIDNESITPVEAVNEIVRHIL
jgi:shikimate kinase